MTPGKRSTFFLFAFLRWINVSEAKCFDYFTDTVKHKDNYSQQVDYVNLPNSKDSIICTLLLNYPKYHIFNNTLRDCYERKVENDTMCYDYQKLPLSYLHFMCIVASDLKVTFDGCYTGDICLSPGSATTTPPPPTTTTRAPTTTTTTPTPTPTPTTVPERTPTPTTPPTTVPERTPTPTTPPTTVPERTPTPTTTPTTTTPPTTTPTTVPERTPTPTTTPTTTTPTTTTKVHNSTVNGNSGDGGNADAITGTDKPTVSVLSISVMLNVVLGLLVAYLLMRQRRMFISADTSLIESTSLQDVLNTEPNSSLQNHESSSLIGEKEEASVCNSTDSHCNGNNCDGNEVL